MNLVASGPQVIVTYIGTLNSGKSFRNTEIFEVADGKIKSVEVYFGWDIPHKAAMGTFLEAELEIPPNQTGIFPIQIMGMAPRRDSNVQALKAASLPCRAFVPPCGEGDRTVQQTDHGAPELRRRCVEPLQ